MQISWAQTLWANKNRRIKKYNSIYLVVSATSKTRRTEDV